MQNHRGNQRCDRTAAAPSSSLKLAAVARMQLWLFCLKHLDSDSWMLGHGLDCLVNCSLEDYQHESFLKAPWFRFNRPAWWARLGRDDGSDRVIVMIDRHVGSGQLVALACRPLAERSVPGLQPCTSESTVHVMILLLSLIWNIFQGEPVRDGTACWARCKICGALNVLTLDSLMQLRVSLSFSGYDVRAFRRAHLG